MGIILSHGTVTFLRLSTTQSRIRGTTSIQQVNLSILRQLSVLGIISGRNSLQTRLPPPYVAHCYEGTYEDSWSPITPNLFHAYIPSDLFEPQH